MPKISLLVLLVLALQSFGLRAELVFRSLEQANGEQRWSAIKKYSNPRDIDYATRPAEQVRVFITGEITGEDAVSAGAMGDLIQEGRQKLVGNTVWLASNGGDIDAAMVLGRILRRFGVLTSVGKDDQCLSACVFAFMGGERRVVAGRLGIHRPFFPSTQVEPDRQVRFRQLQKALRDYIEELDFPPSLYETVMAVPPEAMKFLAPADLKRFTLDGISPSSEDFADAAEARRLKLSMPDYLLYKAKMPACKLYAPGKGQCEGRSPDEAIGATGAPQKPQDGTAVRALGLGRAKKSGL